MKKIHFLLFLVTTTVFAQGRWAADFKSLIGKTYTNESGIKGLKTFRYEQGTVVGEAIEGQFFSTIDVYRKGSTAIILLSKKIKANSDEYRIIDVLKISAIPKSDEVRITDCSRKQAYPDETIVAVVFSGSKRQVKLVKQAYALKDIRFEKIITKGITCINEGID